MYTRRLIIDVGMALRTWCRGCSCPRRQSRARYSVTPLLSSSPLLSRCLYVHLTLLWLYVWQWRPPRGVKAQASVRQAGASFIRRQVRWLSCCHHSLLLQFLLTCVLFRCFVISRQQSQQFGCWFFCLFLNPIFIIVIFFPNICRQWVKMKKIPNCIVNFL